MNAKGRVLTTFQFEEPDRVDGFVGKMDSPYPNIKVIDVQCGGGEWIE